MIIKKRGLLILGIATVISCSAMSKPKDDIVFGVGIGNEPTSLDPQFCSDRLGNLIINELFVGLLRGDPKTGGYRPGLAKNWDISYDNTCYTFHLRDDIYWSDGIKITASTIRDSYIMALENELDVPHINLLTSKIKNAQEFYETKLNADEVGVKVINEQTLEITLSRPASYFLDMLTHPIFIPIPTHIVKKFGNKWTSSENMVTSGPFKLKRRILNEEISLEKNEKFYDAKNVAINELIFVTINDTRRIYSMYEHNEIDAIFNNIPLSLINELILREDFYSADINQIGFFSLNTNVKPLNNVKVREALALAVDRETLTYRVLDNNFKATRKISPNINNYNYGKKLKPYNPRKAEKLLAEAGYPDGKNFPTLTIKYNKNDLEKEVASFIQSQWKKVLNIDVEIEPETWVNHISNILKGQYEISVRSWQGDYLDPMAFFNIFETKNSHFASYGYSNPELDELIIKSDLEEDEKLRLEILKKIEEIIIENDYPIIPIYSVAGNYLFKNDKWLGWNTNNSERFALSEIKPIEE
ncbi:peptide ABC transporter substrate-binding protein [Borreliella burgdorferi]|uniref:peptide ABC transporter substrate-binding protein n=1 Tax=Borreliella burgdorferi TaxID=139 RepID=UPI00016B33A5|nr:peptide ABC transporter substrate-binding protein [Borreliella burgdorferi]ACO37989.1 oligopeptide ABC transporter, periplasmic oligopeptide-binding protein [Borreliella burgdorferi Bol26]MCS2182072.1 peptide ABC transporter substrate-binding protein [Borreliella burgdorferi]PRR03422.1 peptide ABC transporter substrate-binding protein [Borreliella burgdorferi]PRR13636.1 peptide ABC transporter substrate-binding protein [Borreliella burgdorferi]QXG44834.1 peptide ABC transporter substrate-bi